MYIKNPIYKKIHKTEKNNKLQKEIYHIAHRENSKIILFLGYLFIFIALYGAETFVT